MRQALDHLHIVVFGIEVVGAAVGQQGLDNGVVFPGFEAAEEHPVLHAQLGRPDHVLDAVGVDFQNALFEAVEELGPLVERVAQCLADIAGREVGFKVIEDEAVEFVGDGAAAVATDQLAAGGRGAGPAGLGFDLIEALDEVEDGKGNFGAGPCEIVEFSTDVGQTACVAQALSGGDDIIDGIAVGVDGAGERDGVGGLVVVEHVQQASGSAPGVPVEVAGAGYRVTVGPEAAFPDGTVAG